VALESGARRALLPVENKRRFLGLSGEVIEKVDPVFYPDPLTAALKVLGLT
jgi:ATP-dependent Lon protease